MDLSNCSCRSKSRETTEQDCTGVQRQLADLAGHMLPQGGLQAQHCPGLTAHIIMCLLIRIDTRFSTQQAFTTSGVHKGISNACK
jgi:hypothetical protein